LNFAFLDVDANGNLVFTDADAELGHDFGLLLNEVQQILVF
jgi:hypothetical protein